MAGNFIAMVYAVLKDKNVDTSKMTTKQAIEKYNELTGKSGRYSVQTGEKVKNSEIVLTKDKEHSNIQSFPKPKNFGSEKNKNEHKKHIKKMGFKNFSEYEKAAIIFGHQGEGEEYLVKEFFDFPRYYKFNEKTTELLVLGESGTIITYYYVKNKNIQLAKQYFYKDMKKKKGEKLK